MRKFSLNHKKQFQPLVILLIMLSTCLEDQAQKYPIDTLMRNGERLNRINLVYLSDGYLGRDLDVYRGNAVVINDIIFSQAPFKQYKSYFNAYAIRVPSIQSGSIHPGNASDEPTSPVQPVTNPNTIFQSTFDVGGIHRLLVAQNTAAITNTLFNNLPDYSQALVLVNSPYYGGSGAQFPTASAHPLAAEIAIHEMGHSFADLADEYWIDEIYAAEKANMTKTSSPGSVKWKNWVGTNGVGVFPYGNTFPANTWYRPHQDCKMKSLDKDFCSVCVERFVDVIHQKVTMIDGRTPSATSLTLMNKSPVQFSVSTVQTTPTTVAVKWFLNSSSTPLTTPTQQTVTIPYESFRDGNNTVRAEIVDNGPLSKSYAPGVGYVNNLTWTVTVSAAALPVHLISFSGKVTENTATVSWEIDSPDDLQVFELEKSIDGLTFTKTASISGEQFRKLYSYTDNQLFKPFTYYRLKTIEKTGLFHYSNIIRLQNSFEKFYYKVYQQAENHRYHLSVSLTGEEKVSFRVTDIQGRVVSKKDFGEVGKQVEYDFDLVGKTPGIYYMSLLINNSNYTIPLLAK